MRRATCPKRGAVEIPEIDDIGRHAGILAWAMLRLGKDDSAA